MDELGKNSPELTSAEVFDDDLMISGRSFEIDMSGIQRDIEDLTFAIDDALTVYGEMLVDEATVQAMSYADVRQCERAISSTIRAADELRRKLNRDYKVPLDVAKKRYDELMGPVVELHGLYKARRIALDDAEKEAKKQAIRQRYEDMAAYLALPLDGQDEALVPFDRVFAMFGAKWLNKGMALDEVEFELIGIVQRIADGEIRLDAAGLKHATEAKAVFWKTLDFDAAIARDDELCRAEKRQAALEVERLEAMRSQQAGSALTSTQVLPTVSVGESAAAPVAESPARKPRVMLIDGATDDECRQIGSFCKSLGISGVFKGERFYEAVKSLDPRSPDSR